MHHQYFSNCYNNHRDHDHKSDGDSHSHFYGEFNLLEELKSVSIVLILFTTGLVFYNFLHNTPWSIAEYVVFIPAYLISGSTVLTSWEIL
ncbi:MAG: hypothetical protein QNJ32_31335 [Xenococcaceae cyanobacterium MO_167.B27]|nr:hypothetical protein [Xenococcaceae cyanobacterium MO_167.B27]